MKASPPAAPRKDIFKHLSTVKRVELARAKMKRVVDHLQHLLSLHSNNEIVVYSPLLASQIPESYAANAFRDFQHAIHRFEIVRLRALWDGTDLAKENVPTVIDLGSGHID